MLPKQYSSTYSLPKPLQLFAVYFHELVVEFPGLLPVQLEFQTACGLQLSNPWQLAKWRALSPFFHGDPTPNGLQASAMQPLAKYHQVAGIITFVHRDPLQILGLSC